MKKVLAIILAVTLTMTIFTSCGAMNATLASTYLNLGEKYLLDLNYEEAIVYFNKVIEVEPRNVRAYLGTAEAYEALGDIDSAISTLANALEMFSGDTDTQTVFLERLIELEPANAEWYLDLAQVYLDKGDTDAAVEILQKGLESASEIVSIQTLLVSIIGEQEPEAEENVDEENSGAVNTSTISITVWCPEAAVDLTTSQLAAYNEANGTSIQFTVESVGESEAAINMLFDTTLGADIYIFPQDQLARLVQVGALTQVSTSLADTITSKNDAGSVAAATVGGSLYAFPLTIDYSYIVYYDKSVIIDESVLTDQTALIEAVSVAGKTIAFELLDSGWYSTSYFLATGCESVWSADDNGTFVSYSDTYNSEAGIIACKGMAELINSDVFVNSSAVASFDYSNAAVVVSVSDTWDYNTAYAILGDNLGCCELWNFTVGGETYHLGSYSVNKLLGVKPQTDALKAAYCQSVAAYLSGEACQQERFDTLAWIPSNTTVQASDSVQENIAIAASAAQNEYGTPRGQYPDAWWDTSKAIGASIRALRTTSPRNSDLQAILNTYSAGIESILYGTIYE